jgi:hypothetical protein
MKILFILSINFLILFANIGKITSVKGEVYIDRNNNQIAARSGSILEIKDKIITKDASKALVLFNDKTSITIGNNSILAVKKYVFDTKVPSNNKASFGFGNGIFRTITGKVGKLNPKGFTIKTSSATIGIRGTIFEVSVTPKNLVVDVASGKTWVLPQGQTVPTDVPQGKVLTYDNKSKKIKVMVKKDFEAKKEQESKKKQKKAKKIILEKNLILLMIKKIVIIHHRKETTPSHKEIIHRHKETTHHNLSRKEVSQYQIMQEYHL